MRKPLAERFAAKVALPDDWRGCWLWTGALNGVGYGVLGRGARDDGLVYAHRLSFELFVGPIPEGLHIDHVCRTRRCVNPFHLEAVTQSRNNRRARDAQAGRPIGSAEDACIHGHRFTPENTYTHKSGRRSCRTCNRATQARYIARKAAA